MNIARLSIKRPIFITSIVFVIMFTGIISLTRLGVDMFPDVEFPYVIVQTVYVGAGPEEIENLISKPIEDEVSSISGLKRVSSRNMEGVSLVVAQFNLGVDVKYAEQQVKDKVAKIRRNLPDAIDEPLVMRFDPADFPIVRLALSADLSPADLYDLAREEVKTSLQQVDGVASIQIIGGQRREIQVELDRNRLNLMKVSALQVANSLRSAGMNIPIGKHESGPNEMIFRSVGEFTSIQQIENTPVSFSGDVGNAITVKSLGTVRDSVEERTSIGYLYAPVEDNQSKGLLGNAQKKKITRVEKPALFLEIYKQSGANTVAVANGIIKRIDFINEKMKDRAGKPKLTMIYDGAQFIRMNVKDVFESIILGIILAVIVVYLFLGNIRSTIITGIAIPNSLLGAFVLMYIMGYTINVITLLALSLTVGLLVDDAIVVRENIFRKLESGMNPGQAAEEGTNEVKLAVVATTLTIIAVFFPIAFMSGIVGQFFRQFGLTIVFAMAISLFDAMTVAPFLSAYFAGKAHVAQNAVVRTFERFQRWLESMYGRIMTFTLEHPIIVIIITTVVLALSLATVPFIKKTFMPKSDWGEFMVQIEMPPGTSLEGTLEVAKKIGARIKEITPELNKISYTVGISQMQAQANSATLGISLVDSSERKRSAGEIKDFLRKRLVKEFAYAKPKVNEYSMGGLGTTYAFYLNIIGDDLAQLDEYSSKLVERIKKIPDLVDVDTSSRPGKPEFQIQLDPQEMQRYGVMPNIAGAELRYHIAGDVVGRLHDRGLEYDIRLRLKPEQRNLRATYQETRVPNMMYRLVPLSAISKGVEKSGASIILREDRSRVVQITANLAPDGAIGNATDQAKRILEKELPPPKGVTYAFFGQTEDFKELMANVIFALILAVVFIYFILASLYESFITPVTILFALPPALTGAFLGLFIFREMLNMYSLIGMIMLMGLVTKNSILLVDFAVERVRAGMPRKQAIYEAGMIRLRPILMTTFAMMAGTLPVALGIGEVAKFRMAMGIAIISGLILSTFMTLVVVPAIFEGIDIAREWIESKFRPKYKIELSQEQVTQEIEQETVVEESLTILPQPDPPRRSRGKESRNDRKKR